MSTSLSSSSSSQRRKELKQPDGFQRSVGSSLSAVENYQRPLIAIVIAGLLFSFGYVLYSSHRNAKEAAGRDTYFSALQTLKTELADLAKTFPQKEKETTDSENPLADLGKDKTKKKEAKKKEMVAQTADDIQFEAFDVQQKLPKSVADLKKVIDLHPGTLAAHEAEVMMGKLNFDHGDLKGALSWFEKAERSASGKLYQSAARLLYATALEASGDCKQAISFFEKSIALKDPTTLGESYMGKARCLETMNDHAEAKKIYDKIITDMPDTSYSRNAEVLRTQL